MKKDLTGNRFVRWMVLDFVGYVKKNPQWNCLCDCGTRKSVNANDLKSGRSKSCGCLKKEMLIERHKMAHPEGFEPSSSVLETDILPLN